MTASTMAARHPAEPAHDASLSQFVGVILLIVADSAFVLSLVFTYFYLRGLNTDGHWIPVGSATISPLSTWVIAAVMVLSAAAYYWGEVGIRTGNQGRLKAGLAAALALLAADFGIQVWRMATLPFIAHTGSYASTIITFSGANLVHLVLTAILGVAIWNRARLGLFSADRHGHVRLVGYWWAWVAVSAVLIAITTSFVASPHIVG